MLTLVVAFLGLSVGSFLNVVTLRIMSEESLGGRSHCPACGRTLAWFDLVPLFSFLALRGRCRTCGHNISWQYPLVEFVTALLFVIVAWVHVQQPFGLELMARDIIFVSGLFALFIFDFRWMVVPDEVSLPLIVVALLFNLLLQISWISLALGMLIGGGWFFLLWGASGGRWVGSGDIRIGVLLGAMLGLPGTLVALYIAYLVGGVVAAGLLIAGKKKMGAMLPMGTFLTIGGFVALLFGEAILHTFLYGIF